MNKENFVNELWKYRYLFYTFAKRDITLRYKYMAIGIGWAIINPLFLTIILTLAFGKLKAFTANNVPYPVFVYLGFLFWNYFTSSFNRASGSLASNNSLITKIYFPRIILPFAAVAVGLIDFCIGFLFLLAMLIINNLSIPFTGLLIIFPCLLITLLTSLSIGLSFSFLNVKYRDAREILPFLTTTLFFLTPVIYPVRLIPSNFHTFLYFNPMVGVIETVRAVLLNNSAVDWQGFLASSISSLLLFLVSFYYFKKNEKNLADII